MNIYKKLQKCRAELKSFSIQESGNNKFAGYQYMELGDFLPYIVDLCDQHGLCTVISFGEIATLTIVNSDEPAEQIVISSPMSTADLKGCHAIQNLGAVETYLRRYLYVTAFDIVEHDALDSAQGKDPKPAKSAPQPTGTGNQGQSAAGQGTQPQGKTLTEMEAKIKDLLHDIYGDNTKDKADACERLSAIPASGTYKETRGERDFTRLTEKRQQVLYGKLKKIKEGMAAQPCKKCGEALQDGKCWNVDCEDFAG